MKNSLINLSILFLAVLVFKSCSKDETIATVIDASDIPALEAALINDNWRITYYFDSGKNETADYTAYTFTFQEDGILAVSDGNTAASGVWTITVSDNSNDDSSSSNVDFNILFNSPALFQELSDDWEIKTFSNTTLELSDVSGGDGSIDLLTFTKK